jgi:hypothetical protein
VFCSDEYIREEHFVGRQELIEAADVIIIGAPHLAYRDLDFQGKPVVDIWNHTVRQGGQA